ncbi:Single-stranded DNA-binding protein [Vigna angularis]|uniref:Single-stranded DNA-binding protein n=1 Tax=Phaseolus angularis TaxID=3914 RepID=A0A8T0LBY0_PHAAN|nr:Single-stranded DNA-binding protein [Vigna angularis]
MSNLQFQLHSQPSILSSLSSLSSSSLKLLANHSFSSNSLPFNPPKPFSLRCRHSDLFDQNTLASSQRPTRPTASVGALPPRVYVGYSIYKGKAALTLTPRPPEFVPLDSGAYKISKEGYVLLQFAPAVGTRQYDWNRKQVFSLSVGEMGSVISLGTRESCEFFHDPFKGKRCHEVNTDFCFLAWRTFPAFANFIMPYLLGWHTFANSIKPEDTSGVNNANPRYGGDYEWNR